MLTKMKIENFKSFKKLTVLDLQSTNYKILKDKNVTEEGILKGAIFVGGNATGKTNVILAMRVLLELLFRENIMNLGIYKCLFSKKSNIKLHYEFNIEGSIINYNIEYDTKDEILVEKLFVNEQTMLERIGQNGKSYITEIENFTDLSKETLLLRTIYFNTKFYKYEVLQRWFKYLINSVYLDASARIMIDPNKELGLNKYLDRNGTDIINGFFNKYNFTYQIEYSEKSKGNLIQIDNEGQKSIFFKRQEIGEPIPFFMESLGNRNLLNMLPAFFQVIEEGGMLIIDEFSSAFHNELEELLIKFFMSRSKKAQIFLVSHSTNLLSNTIFRPDQEYAVEFEGKEGSSINRFSNEKPREAQNIEKMYNSGCFGGKPEYTNE
jgi:AAA15 family ATPase/GTPase